MPVVDFGRIEGDAALPDLLDAFAKVQKALDYLMQGGLDSQNIRAKSIVADRMSVTQLSAIAADLGTITAGQIFGAYIATSNGTYPRIDFSSSGNLLAAYQTANNYIRIIPSSSGTTPILQAFDGTNTAFLGIVGGTTTFNAQTGNQSIQAQAGDLSLSASAALKLNGASLQINSTPGYTGTVFVSLTSGGPATTPITFTNGIRTA